MVGITVAVLAVVITGRSLGALWALRHIIVLLILFSIVLWPFFTEGPTILYRWHFLKISHESILYGMAMGLRLATFVMVGLLFLATTRNEEVSNGLIRLGLPYPVAFALATALRLVPTFVCAGVNIVEAQISRGLDLDSRNILSRLRAFIPLALPMFISAIRYANLLSLSLESRGFRPGAPRTLFYEPRMTWKDWLILSGLVLLLAGFLYLRLVMHAGAVFPQRI